MVLEYNFKAGWISKDKYENLKAEILREDSEEWKLKR
jgi:hypothetical protein